MSALEHATCELDRASADVDALDAIAELEQRDQIAPGPGSDQQDVIRRLERVLIPRLFPRPQPGQDGGVAARELVPGPGDRFRQRLTPKCSRGEVEGGPRREMQRPSCDREEGERSVTPAAHA